MSKVFVTGCAGLLGANYARHLLQNGHEVIGIDDLSGGYKAFVPKGEKFTFVKLNLERRKKVEELFENVSIINFDIGHEINSSIVNVLPV